MSDSIVRTVYGAHLQTCQLMKLPFTVAPSSTLNEKFNIATGTLTASDMPKMQYVAIGNGGHRMKTTGSNTLQIPEPVQHRTTDAALYAHMPFALRPEADDLSPAMRERYALRRSEIHNGDSYYAYYLRRMDLTTVNAQMEYKAVTAGGVTTTIFQPDSDNLNPIQPPIPSGGTVVTTGDYVTSSARVSFILDVLDVTEILNACEIIYGSPDYGIISEIALCSAVDKIVQSTPPSGGTINFNDVMAAQVVCFITTFHALRFTSNGVNTLFDVGATEPLFLPN